MGDPLLSSIALPLHKERRGTCRRGRPHAHHEEIQLLPGRDRLCRGLYRPLRLEKHPQRPVLPRAVPRPGTRGNPNMAAGGTAAIPEGTPRTVGKRIVNVRGAVPTHMTG